MKLNIPRDIFDNPVPPRTFLCTTGKKIMGEIPAYDRNLNAKWNAYSDFSFSVDRQYTDMIDGTTKVNALFDKIEGLRLVLLENIGYFIIQDPDTTYSDRDSKTLSCFSLEYGTGSKYLENFYINNGAEDAKEVIYEQSKYGYNATKDQMYKPAIPGGYDAGTKYFYREYTDARNYTYEPIQIIDEEAYESHFGDDILVKDVLYVHGWANVKFYDPYTPELSLLHLVFEEIPEWEIGHVDYSLRYEERKFEEDRVAVYDFIMNQMCETFNCVVEWDTLTGRVNFYKEEEDGLTEDNTVQGRFDTDVYISRDNLAAEIQLRYSTDNIKTKLKVSGSDDLDIREVNLGQNYLINLDYYHNEDWMDRDVLEAYDKYLKAVKENSPKYSEAVNGWVEANRKYNDLMNAVPAEGNVVLIGDEFEKLYCVYTPIDTAYLSQTVTDADLDVLIVDNLYSLKDNTIAIDKNTLKDQETFAVQGYRFVYVEANNNFKCLEHMADYNERVLVGPENEPQKGKLSLYHVIDDTEGKENDNILLRLRNPDSDTVTIRIYNKGTATEPEYAIQSIVVNASSGIPETPKEYTMHQWIKGDLTAEFMGLENYTVKYIGIMGAYFVLAKDETQEATLEEYGVNLLKEKHDTYVTIFKTQTEAMFSQEKYRCIVQEEQPDGNYDVGTRWLDTNSNPVVLKEYNGTQWNIISAEVPESDQANYENYQRYIDNYDKMIVVQEVLLQKEKEANYYLDGYAVSDMSIDRDNVTSDEPFYQAAVKHFLTDNDPGDEITIVGTLTKVVLSTPIKDVVYYLYKFTTSKAEGEFVVYLKGKTPYVSYVNSQGVYQAIRDAIAEATNFENFFTKEQWTALSPLIREDEYSDGNFLLTGYEAEEERLKICTELYDAAAKELKTLSQPSIEFSMTMGNILALPEFEPIKSQFALGNFIRIELRPGLVKRSRLLEVSLNPDDLSDFNTTFGNLVTTKSEIYTHADLLKQAVQAGKQVAAAAGDWQSAVDKSNKLEESIAGGLQDAALQIGRASGQAITWDDKGFFCRKFVDGSTDQYENEQIAIINNKIVFTNDGWRTSKAALGEFEIDTNNDGIKERLYGLLADAVVSGYISGSVIEGGSLKIGGKGGKFVVNDDGSVEILGPDDQSLYAGSSAVSKINDAYRYAVELSYNGSTVFASTEAKTIVTAIVRDYGIDITHQLPVGSTFKWLRNGVEYKTTTLTEENKPLENIINTNNQSLTANQIEISHTDIEGNAFFSCQVDFDEEQIIKEEGDLDGDDENTTF